MTVGRKVKLIFIGLSLLATLVIHLPDSPIELQAPGHAFANLIGQEHRWTMFSADPRARSLDLSATLVYEDGHTEEWRIDQSSPFGDFAYYHWIKWMEVAVLAPEEVNVGGLAEWLKQSNQGLEAVVVFGHYRDAPKPGGGRQPTESTVLISSD